MSYQLLPHQTWLYKYQALIKRAVSYSPPGDITGQYTVIASAVPWYLESTPDTSVPTDIGMIAQDNLFVLDHTHWPQGVDIQAGDYFMCTAQPSNPFLANTPTDLLGLWWTVRANYRPHERLANKQVLESKRIINRGTKVTVGAVSATQQIGSTQGLVAGSYVYIPSSNTFGIVDHVVDATHVVFTASVSTATNEVLRLPPPGI